MSRLVPLRREPALPDGEVYLLELHYISNTGENDQRVTRDTLAGTLREEEHECYIQGTGRNPRPYFSVDSFQDLFSNMFNQIEIFPVTAQILEPNSPPLVEYESRSPSSIAPIQPAEQNVRPGFVNQQSKFKLNNYVNCNSNRRQI
jgi:hypothetical protein